VSRPNADEPGSFEPGLEHVIGALTARGYPSELAGRDRALAAFRASSQPDVSRAAGRRTAPRRRFQLRLPGLLAPVRLATVAVAGTAAVFAGLTAAAYAQVLPAPVQEIAHSVLAPLGVPNSQPEPREAGSPSAPTATATTRAAGGQPSAGGTGGAAGAVCPCPATSATRKTHPAGAYTLTLTASKAQVRAGGFDWFTGKVTAHGAAAKGVHVRLLERAAGTSGWTQAARGVTDARGRFSVWIRLRASAAFELAVPAGTRSAPVAVTVTRPAVRLRLSAGQPDDQLVVSAPGGAPGQIVSLAMLVNGTWENVASKPLGPLLHATFRLPVSTAGGHYYRAELAASGTRPSTLSNSLLVPRPHPHTGAKSIGGPTSSPSPRPSASSSVTATGSPAPTAAPAPTASPAPTAALTPTASPTPTGSASPDPVTSSPAGDHPSSDPPSA
jgi:hypothetical protein